MIAVVRGSLTGARLLPFYSAKEFYILASCNDPEVQIVRIDGSVSSYDRRGLAEFGENRKERYASKRVLRMLGS